MTTKVITTRIALGDVHTRFRTRRGVIRAKRFSRAPGERAAELPGVRSRLVRLISAPRSAPYATIVQQTARSLVVVVRVYPAGEGVTLAYPPFPQP